MHYTAHLCFSERTS